MGGGPPRRPAAVSLLLDTHAFLWWVSGSPRLPASVIAAIDAEPDVLVSAVTGYEITLKHALGRLPGAAVLARDVAGTVALSGFRALAIGLRHAEAAGRLPLAHRDPFDRILAAQALVEEMALVSADAALDALGVVRLWD